MARATAFVGGLVLGIALGTAVVIGRADPAEAEITVAAAQAGVDVEDLRGAVNTLQVDPFVYLRSTGELPPLIPPKPPLISQSYTSQSSLWDSLAACESGGNWHAATGNGFQGGLQFLPSTWRAYGGVGSPATASRAQQIAVAQRIQAAAGWSQWPACSRRLGLR